MHLRDDDKAKRAQLLLRHLFSQAIILIISTTALGELYSGRSETVRFLPDGGCRG